MAKKKADPAIPEPVAMAVETVDIMSVSPDPANVRKHGQKNLAAIKASLRRFGQQRPVIVDRNNVVRAGNGTLMAAIALGWKQIVVARSELTGSEMTAFAIVDNRSAELAEWDDDLLAAELGGLREDGIPLDELGFDDKYLDKLLGETLSEPKELALGDEKFLIVVTCKSEADQVSMLERLGAEGVECKALCG